MREMGGRGKKRREEKKNNNFSLLKIEI